MNILPEKKIFTLPELANDWSKSYFDEDSTKNNTKNKIWIDNILSFSAEKFLPIYVFISPKTEMYVYEVNENIGNVSLRDECANYKLQDKDDYFCRDMIQKIATREGKYVNSTTCLELMNPLDIGYLLNTRFGSGILTKYEHMELKFLPHKDPNKIIFIFGEVVSGDFHRITKLPCISIKDLRVLRKDKIKFENRYVKKLGMNIEKDTSVVKSQELANCLDEKHPNFAPELKIANEAWDEIFGKGSSSAKGTKPSLKDWLNRNEKYKGQLSPSQINRIATIINPAHRKEGGAKANDSK